ncbi:MAG: hypothetical protein M1834_007654 [Cirrosporium novae-zelandiae]|nr:MAG: hypothetical protein M1834_007654 [Cirrosporium novae-zelandiae]
MDGATAFSRRDTLRATAARRSTQVDSALIAAIQDPGLANTINKRRRKSFVPTPPYRRTTPSIGLPSRTESLLQTTPTISRRNVSKCSLKLERFETRNGTPAPPILTVPIEDESGQDNHKEVEDLSSQDIKQPVPVLPVTSSLLVESISAPFLETLNQHGPMDRWSGTSSAKQSILSLHRRFNTQSPLKNGKDHEQSTTVAEKPIANAISENEYQDSLIQNVLHRLSSSFLGHEAEHYSDARSHTRQLTNSTNDLQGSSESRRHNHYDCQLTGGHQFKQEPRSNETMNPHMPSKDSFDMPTTNSRQSRYDAFGKAIGDLEILLNEALGIAKKAAEGEDMGNSEEVEEAADTVQKEMAHVPVGRRMSTFRDPNIAYLSAEDVRKGLSDTARVVSRAISGDIPPPGRPVPIPPISRRNSVIDERDHQVASPSVPLFNRSQGVPGQTFHSIDWASCSYNQARRHSKFQPGSSLYQGQEVELSSGAFTPGVDSLTGSESSAFEDDSGHNHLLDTERGDGLRRRRGSRYGQHHDISDCSHQSVHEKHGFTLSGSHRRQPIARDWSSGRKCFVATIACINTSLIGLIVGIYAGEVPAIQYVLADQQHRVILGNVVFYIGLAISTLFFWPLPLLHGRKPYILGALSLLLVLQIPQALAIQAYRAPLALYRLEILLPRGLAGFVAGFANVNFQATLLDLFGASLQSANPHQETVNEYDVRRHGGGMGIWLGIWSACSLGSLGLGFLVGAVIISSLQVAWGFWIATITIVLVMLLNVITPEVRRSPYRRSIAEVFSGVHVTRRIARGEIKMHLKATGPKYWWEEVNAGVLMCLKMVKQPGFFVLSLYVGFIYAHIVIVIVRLCSTMMLLGSLLSRHYRFHPQHVGLCVFAITIGTILAIPFQKASLFSRARHRPQRTDSRTFEKRITRSSHLVRRTIFTIILPFAGLAYTLTSGGPPMHYMLPTAFACLIGFLSALAIAECNGLIMETFDTSDLQPGMTGMPRRASTGVLRMRTNYSCFPRVSAGFAIAQSFGYLLAAAATGGGGVVTRKLSAMVATGAFGALLLLMTTLLTGVLWRWKVIPMIPPPRFGSDIRKSTASGWVPVVIGNPSGRTRRMNILELGRQSRWTEIRKRNRLTRLSLPQG